MTSPISWSDGPTSPPTLPEEDSNDSDSNFTTPPPSRSLTPSSPQLNDDEIEALLRDVIAQPGAPHGYLGIPAAARRPELITRDLSPDPPTSTTTDFHPFVVPVRRKTPPLVANNILSVIQTVVAVTSSMPTLEDLLEVELP